MQQSETFVLRLLTEIETEPKGKSKVSSIMLRSVRSGEQQVFHNLAELIRHLEACQERSEPPDSDTPPS